MKFAGQICSSQSAFPHEVSCAADFRLGVAPSTSYLVDGPLFQEKFQPFDSEDDSKREWNGSDFNSIDYYVDRGIGLVGKVVINERDRERAFWIFEGFPGALS